MTSILKESEIRALAKESLQQFEEEENTTLSVKMHKIAEEACVKIFCENKTIKEALDVKETTVEKFYTHGYHLFQAGKYNEALIVFNFLRKIDPLDMRYSFAIGACFQYQKDYLNAAASYMTCNLLMPDNPIPYFHLYDCFVESNYLMSAYSAIHATIYLCNEDKYATLKEKAELEKEYLEKRFPETGISQQNPINVSKNKGDSL